MGNFNLSSPVDFARVTSGALGSALQNASGLGSVFGLLPGGGNRDWSITEGSFRNLNSSKAIVFHVISSTQPYNGALQKISDSGGRRLVEYQFPYRDGQTTDDLGRRAQSFSLDVILFGNNYKPAMDQLLQEMDKLGPGILNHPVRGQITCRMKDFDLLHESESRKAVALRIHFVEHNFSIASFNTQFKDPSVKGALASALAALQSFQNTLAKIQGAINVVTNVKTGLINAVNTFKESFTTLLQEINGSFNGGSSVDIPSLLPTNTSTKKSSPLFQVASSPNDPFTSVTLQTKVSTTKTVAQVTADVNSIRDSAQSIIKSMETSAKDGTGALVFYDDILNLKVSMNLMQACLVAAVATSASKIVNYVTPRVMTIREVAFANGLSVDDIEQIIVYNPQLLSVNSIAPNTPIQVPLS